MQIIASVSAESVSVVADDLNGTVSFTKVLGIEEIMKMFTKFKLWAVLKLAIFSEVGNNKIMISFAMTFSL